MPYCQVLDRSDIERLKHRGIVGLVDDDENLVGDNEENRPGDFLVTNFCVDCEQVLALHFILGSLSQCILVFATFIVHRVEFEQ